MKKMLVTKEKIDSFCKQLQGGGKERSDDRKILAGGIDAVCKVVVVNWEKALLDKQYAPSTIDGKLAALDRFCCFVAGEIAGENT